VDPRIINSFSDLTVCDDTLLISSKKKYYNALLKFPSGILLEWYLLLLLLNDTPYVAVFSIKF
jgi:hypothetical protein